MKKERKVISKKTRFEVFKRDSFKCCYCGNEAPNVVLEIDHIQPISKGGDNNIINLITSCFNCNRGKSNKVLTESKTLKQQKQQLNILNQKREQLMFLQKWRNELSNLNNDIVNFYTTIICENSYPIELNDFGKKKLLKWVEKYNKQELIEAIEIAYFSYFTKKDNRNDIEKRNNWNIAFDYIPRIIESKKIQNQKPYIKDLHYCIGILKNRLNFCNTKIAFIIIKDLYEKKSWTIEQIKEICLTAKNWTEFKIKTTYEI